MSNSFLINKNNYTKPGVAAYLHTCAPLYFFDETDSTNSYLKQLATQGTASGSSAIAKTQTMGRGRLGRSFYSGGGIYLSVLIKPDEGFSDIARLTAFAGVCARRAILRVTGIDVKLKWVNDILVDGKKAGGILAELVTTPKQKCAGIVIGIGLNTDPTVFPEEIRDKAVSLNDYSTNIDKARLAAELINGLSMLDKLTYEQAEAMLCEYRDNLYTLGRQVTVTTDPPFSGIAKELKDDCSLLVENGSEQRIVRFGEVLVRAQDGKYT